MNTITIINLTTKAFNIINDECLSEALRVETTNVRSHKSIFFQMDDIIDYNEEESIKQDLELIPEVDFVIFSEDKSKQVTNIIIELKI